MSAIAARLNGSNAYILLESADATVASSSASDLDGHLAVINDVEENAYLANEFASLLSEYYNQQFAQTTVSDWELNPIIGYQYKSNQRWVWDDNSTSSYSRWHPGQAAQTSQVGDYAKLYLVAKQGTPYIRGSWISNFGGKTALVEIPLEASFSFDRQPNEGNLFTTSISLSRNDQLKDYLDGVAVYWELQGVDSSDLEEGSLDGTAILTNGTFTVSHKLKRDADLGENIRVAVFSDPDRTRQIGVSTGKDLDPALLETYVEDNSLVLVFSERITISGSGILNPALLSVVANGIERANVRVSNSNIIDSPEGAKLIIPLAGWGIDKSLDLDFSYKPSKGIGNEGFLVGSSGEPVPEISFVSSSTYVTDKSIGRTGLSLAFRNLRLTGEESIAGVGNQYDNTITGNRGDNIIDGLVGADLLLGGLGDDTYRIDNPNDNIIEYLDEGYDTVESAISFVLGDNIEKLVLTDKGHTSAIGNSINNVIIGNSGSNVLDGRQGADTLIGDKGNDAYVVDSDLDIVIETGTRRDIDTVFSSIDWVLGTNLENLYLTDIQSLAGTGNSLDNIITGNGGDNLLDGGGGGRDVLTGGLGSDSFAFSSRPQRNGSRYADIITDFSYADGDRIVISRQAFGLQQSSVGVLIVHDLTAYNRAALSGASFIYNTETSELSWNQNGPGRGFGQGGVMAVLTDTNRSFVLDSIQFV